MAAAGNDLDQTIALGVAANEVQQDAATVGTALKTMSMRLRGSKTDVENAGLDSEGMATSVSKLKDELLSLSGVDIMLDNETFKSSYDILMEIGAVWDNLTDINRANITELLFGKRQANIGTAILQNYERAQSIYETSQNSDGSALAENEKYLNSLQGHLDQFQAKWEAFSISLADSTVLKIILDIAGKIVSVFTKMADIFGSVGMLAIPLVASLSKLGNIGIFKTVEEMSSDGTIKEGSAWGIGGFGNVKKKRAKFHNDLFKQSMKNDAININAFDKKVSEAVRNGADLDVAMVNAGKSIENAGGSVKKFCQSTDYKQVRQFQEEIDKNVKSGMRLRDAMQAAGNSVEWNNDAVKQYCTNANRMNKTQTAMNITAQGAYEAQQRVVQGIKNVDTATKKTSKFIIPKSKVNIPTPISIDNSASVIEKSKAKAINATNSIKGHINKLGNTVKSGMNVAVNGVANGIINAANKVKNGIKGMALSTKVMLKNVGSMLAISLAIEAIGKAWDAVNDKFDITPEKKVEAMEEAVNKYHKSIDKSNKNINTIRSLSGEFKDLSKGISSSGKNIGLTADNYKRYNSIVEKLISLSPSIVKGYTAEGKAIVNQNTAIDEAIKLQKNRAKEATRAYTSLSTGNKIIKGAKVKIEEQEDALRSDVKAMRDLLPKNGDKALRGDAKGSVVVKSSKFFNDILGEEVDINNANYETLTMIDKKRADILKKAEAEVRLGNMSREDMDNLEGEVSKFSLDYNKYKETFEPIYKWLSASMSQYNDQLGRNVSDVLPEALQTGYQSGLRRIAESGEDAATMKAQATTLADTISEQYRNNKDGLADIYREAETAQREYFDAQNDFLSDSEMETKAGEVQGVLDEQADALDKLADKYRKTDPVLADFYASESENLRNFVEQNELSIANAFHGFDGLIESARHAKEEYDQALSGGDYYTGVNNYKSIYKDMFNGQNNKGQGSLSFWQGAEQILGGKALKDANYNIDTVTKKLKHWKPLMDSSADAAYKLGERLYDASNKKGQILDEYGHELATVKKTSDGIKFDIPENNISLVAEKLGVSAEFLTSMLDSARQFSNVNFYNVKEVAQAARQAAKDGDSRTAVLGKIKDKNGKNKVFMDEAVLQRESGLQGKELSKLVKQLEKDQDMTIISASNKIGTIKSDLKELGVLTSKTFKTDDAVEDFYNMGMSLDDMTNIAEKLNNEGFDIEGLEKDGDIADYISKKYKEIAEENKENTPEGNLEATADSAERMVSILERLAEALGATIPPIDIKFNKEEIDDNLSKIDELSSKDKEIIIDATTKYNETGDIADFYNSIHDLPKEVQTEVIASVFGEDNVEEVWDYINELDGYDANVQVKYDDQGIEKNLKEIDELTSGDRDVVINAVADYKETGDLNGFLQTIGELPPEVQTEVLASVFGEDKANYLYALMVKLGMIKANPEVNAVGAELAKQDIGTILDNLGMLPSSKKIFIDIYKTLHLAQEAGSAVTANVAKALGGGGGAKGIGSYRGHSSFPSLARGKKGKGKNGPKGKGGLTLTGELGTELVWIPSESRSFLAGPYGPELLNLPSDAVVYPADETRRIIGGTLPLGSYNFASLSNGTPNFGSMSVGGTISKPHHDYPPKYHGSSSSGGHSSRGHSSRSKSSSKSKGKSSKSKESAFEKGKKYLDHQLEMEYITESTYYNKLNALYKKHRKALAKNKDDQRQALEDLKKAWIDAYEAAKDLLDHQLEMGIINESTYYTKLKALGNKYYAGKKNYVKEYRDHLEELKDARNDAYEVAVDDLDRQLEKELITSKEYFEKIKALQNKWLNGKSMAEDRKEAIDDMFDNVLDAIEDEYDDVQQLIDDKDLFKAWEDGESAEKILNDFKQKVIKYYKAGMIQANEYKDLMMEIEREIQEAKNDAYDDEKDHLDELMDLVEDLVRQETEDKIKALEDQIEAYEDIIDKKKKSLELTEDEFAYMDEMTDLASQIAKKQSEISVLARDDSRLGQSKLAEAQEELAELLKEQNKTVRDETLDKTEDTLDEQAERFEKALEKEIQKLEDFLDNKSAVLDEVVKQIENRDTNKLYDRLIEYNAKYGDGLMKTVTDFWDDLSDLTKKYGNDIKKIVEILQKGTDDGKTGGLIPVHHKGLAAGFTGNGADLKQNEVYRLLTDDELVLNRADQIKLGSQLGILSSITESYSKLAKGVSPNINRNTSNPIEIHVNSPITIQGSATPEAMDELRKFGDTVANNTLTKLNNALRMNGVTTSVSSNARKN